ncbi:MAG TPA: type II toxin-antitoxin system VapC family toxin [Candidatus Bathyarchaeia archaeon]|nr:type II toxin-antitoxin system VapC family toxin [Candidatus Bathyarchaeia archaeon]
MKLLDTDFLVGILRNNKDAEARIAGYDKEGRQATTTINAFELFYGAHKSRDEEHNVKEVYRLLSRLILLPFNVKSAETAGGMFATLERKGSMLDSRDVMIAGVALENQLSLVTRNRKDYGRIPGITIEEW